jgi:hypothetical protein
MAVEAVEVLKLQAVLQAAAAVVQVDKYQAA